MNRDQWTIYHAYRAAMPADVRISVAWSRFADAYVVSMEHDEVVGFGPALIFDLYRGLHPRVQIVPNLRLRERAEEAAPVAAERMQEQAESRARERDSFFGSLTDGTRGIVNTATLRSEFRSGLGVLSHRDINRAIASVWGCA